jgi:hypothetical protein
MLNFFKFLYFENKKIICKSQKGMALLSVLIFTFVLVSTGVAMLTMAKNDIQRSALQRDSTRAFYLAESGIEDSLWKLNTSEELGGENLEDWRPTGGSPYYYPNNSELEYYKVTITPAPETGEVPIDRINIISTGVVKSTTDKVSGKRTIKVQAIYTTTLKVTYDKAMLTDQAIIFQGSPGATITGGDIHSNHSIEVKGPYEFEGMATTSGVPDDWPDTSYSELNDLDDTENGDFSGPGNWPRIDIPKVPYDELKEMAIANGTYFPDGFDSRDYGIDEFEYTGVVYVEGDVIFGNGDSLNITDGALVVAKYDPDDPDDPTGTVEFKNGSNLVIERSDPIPEGAYPGPIALAAQGDILLHASSSSLNGVVQSGGYYNEEGELQPGGIVDFRNSSYVKGAVIAETIWMHNYTTIEYDGDFLGNFTSTTGDNLYQKVSWQEIYI